MQTLRPVRSQGAPTLPDGALGAAYCHSQDYLSSLQERPVASTASLADLRRKLDVPFGDAGCAPTQVVEDLIAATEGGHLGCAGGRFFAWVIGGSLESALAADWLTSVWDQNAALHACGPAASVVEEVSGKWLKQLFNLPHSASFAMTTGCQLAHVTCLAAARHHCLAQSDWDVEKAGMAGSPQLRVFTTSQQHGSVSRAVRLIGIGHDNVVEVGIDDHGRMLASGLEPALRSHAGPKLVILNAGDLNIGAFDDFQTLIPIARQYGAWVHVDAAFGLWLACDAKRRHLLAGCDTADSWATDAHKWLNVPYDNGLAFVRHREAHKKALTVRADYIASDEQARDQIDWNPEWSRRARGFAVYAALRELGREGLSDLVNRTCEYARELAVGIGALDGAELLWEPVVNQGLVAFHDPRGNALADHDRFTDMIIGRINATGEAFFSGTTWRGRRAMRISVCNWRTCAEDVRRTIAAVQSVLNPSDFVI